MPFGPYADFEDCIAQNQDRENPQAFCAWLHHRITGRWPGQTKGGVKIMPERVVSNSLEAEIARVHSALWDLLGPEIQDQLYILHTFKDAVIFREYDNPDKVYEASYAVVGDSIVFGEAKEVENVYVAKRLMEENPNLAAKDLQSILDDFTEARKQWSEDWAECKQAFSGKPGIDNPDALCAWLYYQAEGEWPSVDGVSVKSEESSENEAVELTGPFVFKNDEKRIVYGAVLVPGEVDHDGEVVSAEKVEDAAHEWMERYQNVDLQHSLNNVGIPVESYLLPMEMTVKAVQNQEAMVLPEKTWILGSRLDEETYEAAKKGKLGGYSVMGMKRAALKNLQDDTAAGKSAETGIEAALKKTLLRDLGEDWVPVYVSVVDRPAVPKAKFFALKSAEEAIDAAAEEEQDKPSLWDRIAGVLVKSSAEKEGRRFSASTVAKLKAAADALSKLVQEVEQEEQQKAKTSAITGKKEKGGTEMEREEIQALMNDTIAEQTKAAVEEAVKSAVEEALNPFKEELQSVKAQLEAVEAAAVKEPDEPTADTDPADAGDSAEPALNEELEAFKAEIIGTLEDFSKKLGVDSAALKGQDGEEEEPGDKPVFKRYQRDVFGRRLQSLS